MSHAAIRAFYKRLEVDEPLRTEALTLQVRFEDQDQVIDEFLRLAERAGYSFTIQEYVAYLYEQAMAAGSEPEVKKK